MEPVHRARLVAEVMATVVERNDRTFKHISRLGKRVVQAIWYYQKSQANVKKKYLGIYQSRWNVVSPRLCFLRPVLSIRTCFALARSALLLSKYYSLYQPNNRRYYLQHFRKIKSYRDMEKGSAKIFVSTKKRCKAQE